jgi:hypothetical protein
MKFLSPTEIPLRKNEPAEVYSLSNGPLSTRVNTDKTRSMNLPTDAVKGHLSHALHRLLSFSRVTWQSDEHGSRGGDAHLWQITTRGSEEQGGLEL